MSIGGQLDILIATLQHSHQSKHITRVPENLKQARRTREYSIKSITELT